MTAKDYFGKHRNNPIFGFESKYIINKYQNNIKY